MPGRRLPFLLTLLAALPALALAGCAEDPDPAPAEGEEVGVITDPRDLLNGTAPGSHIHDYWGGRGQVTVLDESWEGSRWSCGGCSTGGMQFADTRPAEGAIVPQGTRWVNGTFTIDDPDHQYTGLELWVKTAQDVELRRWGPLESGVPFSIETTQEANDPPHYVLSLWQFAVVALGGDQVTAGGSMAWSVEAVRGLPLVPYPPHPDRWGSATELDLLQDGGGTQLTYVLEVPEYGTNINCNNGCPGLHTLPSGTVVPHDTGRVEVRLRVTEGAPAGLGLWVHGADTWEFTRVEGAMATPGETLYTIPIEGSMADSPYAPQSLWEFQVWLDQPQPHLQAWSGQYSIEVRALRA